MLGEENAGAFVAQGLLAWIRPEIFYLHLVVFALSWVGLICWLGA